MRDGTTWASIFEPLEKYGEYGGDALIKPFVVCNAPAPFQK